MNLSSQEIIKSLGNELVNMACLNPNIETSLKKFLKSENISGGIVFSGKQEWIDWSTDSRQKTNHGLFFALVGENFDAHDFIFQAYENGARGFVVSHAGFEKLKSNSNYPQMLDAQFFITKNTEVALQKIAVTSSKKVSTLKVAITGTSGKTSAKYFCHQMLEGYIPHYFSPKSFNNHIGVPMTLLELKEEHKVGLIEIGMNHPGEIDQLVQMAQPDIAVVTMVGRGHLEGVGTIEQVLEEKMCIFKAGHTHIINQDDPRIYPDYKKRFAQNLENPNIKILTISTKDPSADIYFHIKKSSFDHFEIEGHILKHDGAAQVKIAGEHHVYNVAIASAVAVATGMNVVDVWTQIQNLQPVWGRSEILKSKNDVSIYFDAYNANPESMKAFLKQTQLLSEAPYFILGEMLEMGSHASDVHYELGRLVALTPHKKVWFIGPSSDHFKAGYQSEKGPAEKENNLMISNSYEESLAMKYQSMLQPKDWVALKASRGIGLEKFLKNFV